MTFPSWFSIEMSTRRFHTFSSAIMQSDSKSTQRDSRNVLSKIRLIWTDASEWVAPISTLMKSVPSLGLVALGVLTSHDTWANTRVSPKEHNADPKFSPNNKPMSLNSFKARLSILKFSRIAASTKAFSQFDNTVSLIFDEYKKKSSQQCADVFIGIQNFTDGIQRIRNLSDRYKSLNFLLLQAFVNFWFVGSLLSF